MGRPPIGTVAMTSTERSRRRRAGLSTPAATKHATKGGPDPRDEEIARLKAQLWMQDHPQWCDMSDRAIAAEVGVDRGAVKHARDLLKAKDEEEPTDEECDQDAQEAIHDGAREMVEQMTDATRQRFFAYVGRKKRKDHKTAGQNEPPDESDRTNAVIRVISGPMEDFQDGCEEWLSSNPSLKARQAMSSIINACQETLTAIAEVLFEAEAMAPTTTDG
jgi:hypothetical protein